MRNADELSMTDRARAHRSRRPFARRRTARREQRQVDPGKAFGSQRLDPEIVAAKGQRLADRTRRRDEAQLADRKIPFGKDRQKLGADRAGGADDGDDRPRTAQVIIGSLGRHARLLAVSRGRARKKAKAPSEPGGALKVVWSPRSARTHLQRPAGGRLHGLALESDGHRAPTITRAER
jgi:hypothetical protein